MKGKPTTKTKLRERRHARVRARIVGSAERPRLTVFRSNRFISAQIIDDAAGTTLAASHGRTFTGPQSSQAAAVGVDIAKKAKQAGVGTVVFDRGGYRYAGGIKALAEAARGAGLAF